MKEYQDSVEELYELINEFVEDMENALDQLKRKNEKILEKVNALIGEMRVPAPNMDGEELARQAGARV